MMTRKDYQGIADTIRELKPAIMAEAPLRPLTTDERATVTAWQKSVHLFTFRLARTYPNFDSVKFLQACGA
jgi:hypothetical protein